MNGKWPAVALILAALGTGAGVWYAQEYAYYEPIEPGSPAATVLLQTSGGPVTLTTHDFQGIDADSSPIRWRACFRLDGPLPADPQPFVGAEPRGAPNWFDCFDYGQIDADIASGAAIAVLSQPEIRPDVDRVLAIYPDGRAYGWHQPNDKTPERGVMD